MAKQGQVEEKVGKEWIAERQVEIDGIIKDLGTLDEKFDSVSKRIVGLSLDSEPAELSAAFQELRQQEADTIQAAMQTYQTLLLSELLFREPTGGESAVKPDAETAAAIEDLRRRLKDLNPTISTLIQRYEVGMRRLAEDIALIYKQRQEERQRRFQNIMTIVSGVIAFFVAAFTIYDIFYRR